ncbi:MAG: hypothetical protein J0H08_17370 [Rhizobiales bacterium]|nr:hypothetical protein [Hyphomicrobiales bacterium]
MKLNVIQDYECERIQTTFEEALSLMNPAKQGVSPKNWTKEDLPLNMHGIQETSRLAHLSVIKDVRMHPHVVSCWRSLLRTDDISTSWDRVNYMPVGYNDGARAWHHTDVGPAFFKRTDLDGYIPIQSYVQLSKTCTNTVRTEPLGNAPTADPCIVLWEHSNLAHAEYFRRKGPHFDLKTSNWHIYPAETVAQWEKDGREFLPARHPAKRRAEAFPMRRPRRSSTPPARSRTGSSGSPTPC